MIIPDPIPASTLLSHRPVLFLTQNLKDARLLLSNPEALLPSLFSSSFSASFAPTPHPPFTPFTLHPILLSKILLFCISYIVATKLL